MIDSRLHPRSLCADLVTLEWEDEAGRPQRASALLEDISPAGACLQTDVPVPVQASVRVAHGLHWSMPCRTAYCSFREIGYFVGLVFDEEHWKEASFRPQHLLNLAELLRNPVETVIH